MTRLNVVKLTHTHSLTVITAQSRNQPPHCTQSVLYEAWQVKITFTGHWAAKVEITTKHTNYCSSADLKAEFIVSTDDQPDIVLSPTATGSAKN